MKTSSKIALMILLGLVMLQFSFVVFMMEENHQNVCTFDNRCIFQSVINNTQGVIPLLGLVTTAILFFVFSSKIQFESTRIDSVSTDFLLRRKLKGIIQRE